MNPLIILNDVWDDPTKAAGWRAKLSRPTKQGDTGRIRGESDRGSEAVACQI